MIAALTCVVLAAGCQGMVCSIAHGLFTGRTYIYTGFRTDIGITGVVEIAVTKHMRPFRAGSMTAVQDCCMVAIIAHIVPWGFTCSYVMRFVDIKSFA